MDKGILNAIGKTVLNVTIENDEIFVVFSDGSILINAYAEHGDIYMRYISSKKSVSDNLAMVDDWGHFVTADKIKE